MAKKKLGLLVCPFCGGFVHIEKCDMEGNIRNDIEGLPEDETNYLLVHEESDVPKGRVCPIATFDDGVIKLGLGNIIYDSYEEAYKTWTQ